jgi:hypothetical protein
MSAILNIEAFLNPKRYYFIPVRFNEDKDRLTGVIRMAQNEFCSYFGITDDDIDNSEKKLALKYFTFGFWLKSERYGKTSQGTGVDPNLVKGSTNFDIQKYVYCTNYAIRLMNKYLSANQQRKELKAYLNY